MTTYLSFNPLVKDALLRSPPVLTDDDTQADLPLSSTWVLWEQSQMRGAAVTNTGNYADCTSKVISVGTVYDFWRMFLSIPQPSVLIQNQRIIAHDRGESDGRAVSCLMFFKEGVRPEWEDPANANGGHFFFHLKSGIKAGQLDEYWNNLILALIGNTLEPTSDNEYPSIVQGIRLVDKVNSQQKNGGVRIELWFGKCVDDKHMAYLRTRVIDMMTLQTDDSHSIPPKCEVRYHASDAQQPQ